MRESVSRAVSAAFVSYLGRFRISEKRTISGSFVRMTSLIGGVGIGEQASGLMTS